MTKKSFVQSIQSVIVRWFYFSSHLFEYCGIFFKKNSCSISFKMSFLTSWTGGFTKIFLLEYMNTLYSLYYYIIYDLFKKIVQKVCMCVWPDINALKYCNESFQKKSIKYILASLINAASTFFKSQHLSCLQAGHVSII